MDKQDKQGFVYSIINIHTGKKYIGYSTRDYLSEVRGIHHYNLKHGIYPNSKLYRDMRLYGTASFEFEVMEYVDVSESSEMLKGRCRALRKLHDTANSGLNEYIKAPHYFNMAKGSKHYKAKFVEDDIRFIREAGKYGITPNTMADYYKVHPRTIRDILNYKTWKHVD